MRNPIRLRLATLLACALPLAASACMRHPFLSDARVELSEARRRWERAGIDDYQYTLARLCFCPVTRMRVTVVNGAVVSRVDVATGQPVPADRLTSFDTVEELFDLLGAALDRDPAEFDASYDSGLGYPVSAFIDPVANAVDEEHGFEVTGFVASAP